jgi:hypothetical protein
MSTGTGHGPAVLRTLEPGESMGTPASAGLWTDGWFGARTHDAAGPGDWTPDPARFPDGGSAR